MVKAKAKAERESIGRLVASEIFGGVFAPRGSPLLVLRRGLQYLVGAEPDEAAWATSPAPAVGGGRPGTFAPSSLRATLCAHLCASPFRIRL